ncbi:putative HNHc nuclease [Wukongibacter sp. M2B1]|uniref:putative HNHc nuclease n=1 Tax=Wukongibacter sp. M2B1 TaxID=3088895 RepID=UPI003D7A96B2
MKVHCEIDNTQTLKKSMKIVLKVPQEQRQNVMKNIHNFLDKPITVDFLIDTAEYQERIKRISPEQRKKIYALFKDISNYTGMTKDDAKENMKSMFIQNSEYEDFSLSDCSKELAENFIEFIIRFCFEHGIELSEHPKDGFNDIERFLALCLKNSVCAVCGKPSETHHWDAIGMGNDRKTIDDSKHRKIALCRVHHTEAHTIGRDEFKDKYKVWGIIT